MAFIYPVIHSIKHGPQCRIAVFLIRHLQRNCLLNHPDQHVLLCVGPSPGAVLDFSAPRKPLGEGYSSRGELESDKSSNTVQKGA